MNEMINGVWLNKNTGERVTVSNTIIDGNNMIIITDKGQIDMNEFSQNFIQASDDIFDESGKVIGNQPINANDIVVANTNNNSQIYYNDMDVIVKPSKGKTNNSKEPDEYKVLEKFFNKLDNIEDLISIDIDFEKLPIDKLKTLIEYLDIDKEIIAEYMSEKLIDISTIKNIILNKVEQYL